MDEKKGGSFSLQPSAPFRVEREYLDDSAILQPRFITDRGVVKLTDFFVIARKSNARFYDFTTLHATRRLARLVSRRRRDSNREPGREMPTPPSLFRLYAQLAHAARRVPVHVC